VFGEYGCCYGQNTRGYSNEAFSCGKPNSTLLENAITSITGCFMAHRYPSIYLAMFVGALSVGSADARSRSPQDSSLLMSIEVASPTLAPFQHVRFCLRYPSDCKSDPTENNRIDLNEQNLELLKRVNHSVNMYINPRPKSYGPNLGEGWTIAPEMGDCNDYAVTKRHQLLESGLPSKALRLSVVKTTSGIGHLVLVVVTTKGDIVMDDLTEVIRPWQSTDYHWLKIQSATDSKLWYEIKRPAIGPSVSQADRRVRLADQ
jgi:predicted transglutaminase-like cysteine proteinase